MDPLIALIALLALNFLEPVSLADPTSPVRLTRRDPLITLITLITLNFLEPPAPACRGSEAEGRTPAVNCGANPYLVNSALVDP